MSYRFFSNKECEHYPCHNSNQLNCLFCYCPLYNLECKGNFTILGNGKKDCSKCNIPHNINGYDYINKILKEKK